MKTVFYTGVGDKGSSKLGKRKINKDNILFEVLGTLDELNSWLGLVRASIKKKRKFNDVAKSLKNIQENLFIAQAEVAALGMDDSPRIKITKRKTKEIELEIVEIDKKVPQIKNFIIPGATELSAALDVTRAISRRLERKLVSFQRTQARKRVSPHLLQYSNRLSSLLFALARLTNHKEKVQYEHPKYK